MGGLEGLARALGSLRAPREGRPARRAALAVGKQDSRPALPVTWGPRQSHPAAWVTAFLCKQGVRPTRFLGRFKLCCPCCSERLVKQGWGWWWGAVGPDSMRVGELLWIPLPQPPRALEGPSNEKPASDTDRRQPSTPAPHPQGFSFHCGSLPGLPERLNFIGLV